jgi:hypothetical protein
MAGLSKRKFKIRNATVVAAVAVYATISCAVDLFHNEACRAALAHPSTTGTICNGDPCPACMFLAGSSSTEPGYAQTLTSTESGVAAQVPPRLMIVNRDEWACSIISRGPPALITS